MKIVCLGDSLTYGYGVPRKDTWVTLLGEKYGVQAVNEGINGDTTAGMLARFETAVAGAGATHAVITGGSNDLFNGVPLAVVQSNILTLVFHALGRGVRPVVGAPIPVVAEMVKLSWPVFCDLGEVNRSLVDFRKWMLKMSESVNFAVADFYGCVFEGGALREDYYLDGLHLNAKGNIKMAAAVAL
jgi:lysophospholipase L1-like esterase